MLFNIDNQILSPGQVNGNTLSNPALSPFIAVITGTSDCAALVGGCSANPYKNENDNYVTPPNSNQWNHYHNTDITSQFAKFIERNILNAQPGNCAGSTLCNRNPAISGSDVICTTGQYQLTNFPQGVSIVWEAQNSRVRIDNGQGTNRIDVTYLSSGLEVIKVTITDACGVSVVRTKTINVGTPVVYINYSTQGQCYGGYQTWSLQATSPGTVSSWLWTVDNPSSGDWYIDNPTSPFTYVNVSGGGGISVTATNSCGTARTGVTIYSNCDYYRYTISPNPASSAVTVEAKQTDNKEPNEATITEINIYDPQGMLKKNQKYGKVKKATLTLNIPDLKTGVYIIEIVDGNRKERQQLSVLK